MRRILRSTQLLLLVLPAVAVSGLPNSADAAGAGAGESQPFVCAIAGEVVRPGQYAVPGQPLDIQDLLKASGGFAKYASGGFRVVRGGRTGQFLFYSPQLRYEILPGDLVLVEATKRPTEVMLVAGQSHPLADGTVQLAFVGLTPGPVVLKMRTIDATIPQIVQKLRQPSQIISTIQVLEAGSGKITLARGDDFQPLANGSVLIFDPRYVLRETLPAFPGPISLDQAAEASTDEVAAPLPTPMDLPDKIAEEPGPSLTQISPNGATRTAMRNGATTAMPMTHAGPPQSTPMRLAQGPSRFERSKTDVMKIDEGPADTSATNVTPSESPDVASTTEQTVEQPTSSAATTESITDNEDADAGAVSLWHILGIAGALALLMTLAIASRPKANAFADQVHLYNEQSEPLPQQTVARSKPRDSRIDRFVGSTRATVEARDTAEEQDETDILLDMLVGNLLPIVEEAPAFGDAMSFFGGPKPAQEYRLDEPHAQAGQSGPHVDIPALTGGADLEGKSFSRHQAEQPASQAGRPRRPKFLKKQTARETVKAPVAQQPAPRKVASGGILDRTLLNLRGADRS